MRMKFRLCSAVLLLGSLWNAHAADWSDTFLSWRYGTQYREPYNPYAIKKNILSLTHASGYKYGANFFNIDLLMSNRFDPGVGPFNPPATSGAQEAYLVYRNTLDFGKLFHHDLKWGYIRSLGMTGGYDWNTRNDAKYGSKKRMLVLGPTIMLDVPGFLLISLEELWESNQPKGISNRYSYRPHPMINFAWAIPLFGENSIVTFEGFANLIASKGQNEFGGPTFFETNFDGLILFDVSQYIKTPKKAFRVGFEYQYWKNKFGTPPYAPGTKASTPMVRAEYHF